MIAGPFYSDRGDTLHFPGGVMFGAHDRYALIRTDLGNVPNPPGTRLVIVGLYGQFGDDWRSHHLGVVNDFGDVVEVRQ